MKSFIKNKAIILIILFMPTSSYIHAQTSCVVYDNPNMKSVYLNPLNKSTNTTLLKTIRVNIHFILKSDGTGNFTETTDLYGTQNAYTGYWFADKVIEQCNYWLNNNQEMTQQLSCCPIDVEDINYKYRLAGVFFDKSDYYFNNPDVYSGLVKNGTNVVNVLVYQDASGSGAAYLNGNVCFHGGAKNSYDSFLQYGGNWGIYNFMSLGVNHEVGHCFSLKHSKRSSGGDCCTSNSSTCLDDCDDTPTYLELFNDGYTDPCIWNGTGYSNNIMDYSPLETAYTPCQIGMVHDHIDFAKNNFKYGVFQYSSVSITSFSTNATFIANNVTIPSGYSISIPNGKRLYVDAESFEALGAFEVPLGSEFEFVPYGI